MLFRMGPVILTNPEASSLTNFKEHGGESIKTDCFITFLAAQTGLFIQVMWVMLGLQFIPA